MYLIRVIVVLSLANLLSLQAAVLSFPDMDNEWSPLRVNGGFYSDPLGDVSPSSTDIVGDASYAAGYWYLQDKGTESELDDELLVRVRLADEPNNPQSVWQILFNTDDDAGVDWALIFDASGNPDIVAFKQATVEGPTVGDVRFSSTATWSSSVIGEYVRWTDPAGDGSNLSGNGDVFLDFGMPWSVFSLNTGLSRSDSFFLGFSTGASDQINKDGPLNLTLSDPISAAFSDAVSGDNPSGAGGDPQDPLTGVPEPSTFSMLMMIFVGFAADRHRFWSAKRDNSPA